MCYLCLYELTKESNITNLSCLYVSDQGVRQGDSGAGLTFEYDNLQYLRGVVSLRDLEINNSVALFTDVSYNSRWICDTIMNYTDIKSDCQYFAFITLSE